MSSRPPCSSATRAARRRWWRRWRRCTCKGGPTRKVKAITEELCGHRFSASTISAINKGLDEALARFAQRQLDEPYPYLIVDARYEKVRENGVIRSMAVQVAIGINWEGQRRCWRSMWPIGRAGAVGRISCCGSGSALCVETHEAWLEDNRHLNMAMLAEQKKELMRLAA